MPNHIPFAFKESSDKELDQLEKHKIIEKVPTSEWETPLVPILKEDGTIRLAANYKITINEHLKDYNYPIPRSEELFAALE